MRITISPMLRDMQFLIHVFHEYSLHLCKLNTVINFKVLRLFSFLVFSVRFVVVNNEIITVVVWRKPLNHHAVCIFECGAMKTNNVISHLNAITRYNYKHEKKKQRHLFFYFLRRNCTMLSPQYIICHYVYVCRYLHATYWV